MEDEDEEQARPLIRNPIIFDANHERTPERPDGFTPMPHAAQGVRDPEDLWAELGWLLPSFIENERNNLLQVWEELWSGLYW